MTKYREIIRLTGLGFSQRDIMASCGVAQKTVVKVQKRARELNISWPLDEAMTDTELQRLMFSKENKVSPNKRIVCQYSIPAVALLNPGGATAQFKRNDCSIPPVEVIWRGGVRTAACCLAIITV